MGRTNVVDPNQCRCFDWSMSQLQVTRSLMGNNHHPLCPNFIEAINAVVYLNTIVDYVEDLVNDEEYIDDQLWDIYKTAKEWTTLEVVPDEPPEYEEDDEDEKNEVSEDDVPTGA